MSERASNLIGGMCGILAMLASQLGFFAVARGSPGLGASEKDIADFVSQSSTRVYAGGFIELFGLVLFVVFAGRLWAILRRAEGGDGWLSTAAFGTALASMAVGIGGALSAEVTAFYAGQHRAAPGTVTALLDLSALAFLSTGMLLAVFLGATAVVALRHGALPRWLGWFAAVLAVAFPPTLPFPNDLAYIPHMLLVLWVVAVGVVLIRRRELRDARASVPAEAQA